MFLAEPIISPVAAPQGASKPSGQDISQRANSFSSTMCGQRFRGRSANWATSAMRVRTGRWYRQPGLRGESAPARSNFSAHQVRRPARQMIPDQENLAGRSLSSPPPGTPQQANPLHRGVVARSTIEPSNQASSLVRTHSNPPAPERSWNPPSPLPVEAAPAA